MTATLAVDLVELATTLMCAAAFGGLVWRLIGRWPTSYPLARLIVALFALLELLVALAVARRAAIGGEFNEIELVILLHAVFTVVVVAFWPRLLNLGDRPAYPVK